MSNEDSTHSTEFVANPNDVISIIRQRKAREMEPFIETRYPHTYAYDYLRENWDTIREVTAIQYVREDDYPYLSRGDASVVTALWSQDLRIEKDALLYVLADAYLQDHRVDVSMGDVLALRGRNKGGGS